MTSLPDHKNAAAPAGNRGVEQSSNDGTQRLPTSASQHLAWWFAHCTTGRTVFTAFGPSAGSVSSAVPIDRLDDAETFCARHHDWTVYFRTTVIDRDLRPGERGGAKDTITLPGVWIDVDVADPGHAPGALPRPDRATALDIANAFVAPSLLIETGGGFHAYWRFAVPVTITGPDDLARCAELSARWQALHIEHAATLGYALDNTGDLARVLRPVGTVRRKAGCDEFTVRAIAIGSDVTVADIESVLPAVEPAPHRAAPLRLVMPSGEVRSTMPSAGGGITPTEAVAQTVTLADVLAADRSQFGPWTYDGQHGRWEHWTRAGAATSPSLKQDTTTGHIIVTSSTIASAWGVRPLTEAVSLLAVLAHTNGLTPGQVATMIGHEAARLRRAQ
jgi:hypothetical protein